MRIITDLRKHELLRLLKNLYYLAKKDDFQNYKKLKKIYDNLLFDIFGNFKHGEEGFFWDKARNGIDTIFTLRWWSKALPIADAEREKKVKLQVDESSVRIK